MSLSAPCIPFLVDNAMDMAQPFFKHFRDVPLLSG